MNPLVSVIIPVFNGERYLAEALDSVFSQTYQPVDIIVVDDGSVDQSADIVGRLGRSVTYVYQANQGAGAARNRGVSISVATHLAFLDQDDVWSKEKLAQQMDMIQADPLLDMVFGQIQQFYSPDWETPSGLELYCPQTPVPGYLPSAMLMKRESFFRVGPFGTHWRVGEWADWYVRAVDARLATGMLSDLVAWRRIHARNQGLVSRTSTHEYVRILKASLDRRRGRDRV